MKPSASSRPRIAGLGRQRAGYVACPDRPGAAPAVALVLLLAGCAGSQQAGISHRQPSLRVADAALAAGAPEVALRVAELTLEREPRNSLALIAKGDALYQMGERMLARTAYQRAVAIDPTAVAAQLGFGRTLIQSDPGAAEAAFLAAAAAEPNNVSALSDLGVAQDLQGHHAGAQDAYRRALAIAPDMVDLKVNLGLSLALSGSRDEAVRVLHDVAADPNAAQDRRKELAGALALAGDEVDARQVLSSAFGHPEPSRPTSAAAEDFAAEDLPRSASHQASANRNALRGAPGVQPTSIEAKRATPDLTRLVHEPTAMNRSVTAEYDVREPPDMPSAPPAVLAAPVVAVTRVRQLPPPDLSRVAASVVDIAAQRESAQTGTPPAAAPEPDAAPASSPASTDPAHHLAPAVPKQTPMPEGQAYVQLASLHSNEDAWYEWRRLNRRMPELLSGHESIIKQAEARGQTYWVLRTFGYTGLDEAKAMCARMLDAVGLRCWARLGSS